MKKSLPYLSLFFSFSTLICCAIPAALVSLGMGAALASAVSTVPQLVWFSEHKVLIFSATAICLLATYFMRIRTRDLACPTDPKLALACSRAKKFGDLVFIGSVIIFLIGSFFAFVAGSL